MIITEKNGVDFALQERIKELKCLYGMACLAEKHHDSIKEFLKSLVDFLPLSWQHADVACARIIFHAEVFESKGFELTKWRQSALIRIGEEIIGEVNVIYVQERPTADDGPFLKEERELLDGVGRYIGEIILRIMAEQELQEKNKQLLLEREALKEANAVLRIILTNIEDEKKRIYESIQLNIDKVIMPIIHSLTTAEAKNKRKYIEILRTNLEEITSPFINRISNHYRSLTPTEVNICYMIRNGLRTKEIANLRGVSSSTINKHREQIRQKLKITNQQINLTTYLQSFLEEETSKFKV